jgi:hypothetical protein
MRDGLTEAEEGVMARIAELQELAREMLDSFIKTSDGHRARVGQVQIARWQKRLEGGTDG